MEYSLVKARRPLNQKMSPEEEVFFSMGHPLR